MSLKKLLRKKVFPIDANYYSREIYQNLLLNNAMSRCAITATTRNIKPELPSTWEFSGFSQNGEDGIIDYLLTGLNQSNKFFIEIGSGNGLENNTAYLAHIKKFTGIQVEGSKRVHEEALIIKPWLVESLNIFVTEKTVIEIYGKALYKNPDVFSLDIDGMDYYIMSLLLEQGLRPKIIVVEYNSAFGPQRSATIPYKPDFDMYGDAHPFLYYGVSITGWKKLFAKYGYHFVTVETNGVNAFFVNRNEFKSGFFDNVQPLEFKENIHQARLFKKEHNEQYEIMENLPFINI
jgi:hypothetical protein